MTHLRKMMLEELERRNYAQTTIDCYIQTIEDFAGYFRRPPDQLTPEHIREYQAYLFRERKLAASTVTQRLAALRFFYTQTIKKAWSVADTPYPKKTRPLPSILSPEEVTHLIDCSQTRFHRMVLMTLYGTGVRRAELARLQRTPITSRNAETVNRKIVEQDRKCAVCHEEFTDYRELRDGVPLDNSTNVHVFHALRRCSPLEESFLHWFLSGGQVRVHNHKPDKSLGHLYCERQSQQTTPVVTHQRNTVEIQVLNECCQRVVMQREGIARAIPQLVRSAETDEVRRNHAMVPGEAGNKLAIEVTPGGLAVQAQVIPTDSGFPLRTGRHAPTGASGR